ncbi:MAG TPA: NAD-dependent epimerase/dehydratase family protein [Bryobacteraceae bacterium]|nr:NAD-dependent epimerase/dehydratase family protein [Bryobacteraceae bacterium]
MILVTGGSGFIGGHLVELLAARGEAVRCLVRPRSSLQYLRAAEFAYGDLAKGQGLEAALDGVDTVIHAAGVIKALTPEGYFEGNTKASENLARAIGGRPIRLVHVSSLAAIGPSVDGVPITEDAEPHPLTYYGKSKLEAERTVRRLLPDAVIVRPPVVYGPRDTGVLQMFKSVSRGLALEIAGGDRWFSAIYVKDLVRGLVAAARSPAAAGRSYFLAHPAPVSWGGLTTAAARVMGRPARIVRVPVAAAQALGYFSEVWAWIARKPGIVSREKIREALCPFWTCDTRRAAVELGFEAGTALETGLAETLKWYKEARWLRF